MRPLRDQIDTFDCILVLASSCYIFFEVAVDLLLGPLRVDVELPRRPSEPHEKRLLWDIDMFEKNCVGTDDGLESVSGLSWAPFGYSRGGSWECI